MSVQGPNFKASNMSKEIQLAALLRSFCALKLLKLCIYFVIFEQAKLSMTSNGHYGVLCLDFGPFSLFGLLIKFGRYFFECRGKPSFFRLAVL